VSEPWRMPLGERGDDGRIEAGALPPPAGRRERRAAYFGENETVGGISVIPAVPRESSMRRSL